MKRSTINQILQDGGEFIRSFGFVLPPFANWSPDEMKQNSEDIAGVIEARLGWDTSAAKSWTYRYRLLSGQQKRIPELASSTFMLSR